MDEHEHWIDWCILGQNFIVKTWKISMRNHSLFALYVQFKCDVYLHEDPFIFLLMWCIHLYVITCSSVATEWRRVVAVTLATVVGLRKTIISIQVVCFVLAHFVNSKSQFMMLSFQFVGNPMEFWYRNPCSMFSLFLSFFFGYSLILFHFIFASD